MSRSHVVGLVAVLLAAFQPVSALGQGSFQRGDVLVSGVRPTGPIFAESTILVFGSDGVFKRVLAVDANKSYKETLVDPSGIVLVAVGFTIQRMDSSGAVLGTFVTNADQPRYLAPAMDGRIFMSTSLFGNLYGYRQDGWTVFQYTNPNPGGQGPVNGIDLAPDQCTLFAAVNDQVARFDVCRGQFLGKLVPALPFHSSYALRLLGDGSILVAYHTGISHLDSAGNSIRQYAIPAYALGLDVDGTSFWTGYGDGLMKIDIATGQVLVGPIATGYDIFEIGVVGEPRASLSAAIPTLSPAVTIFLICVLATVAFRQLSA